MHLAPSLSSSMFMRRRPSIAAVATIPGLSSLMIWRIACLSCCKAATLAVRAAGLDSASLSSVQSMILQISDRRVSRDSITASSWPSRALVMYSCKAVVMLSFDQARWINFSRLSLAYFSRLFTCHANMRLSLTKSSFLCLTIATTTLVYARSFSTVFWVTLDCVF
jgi:hypothetical protein